MRRILLASQKGGTGKSTTATALAVGLAGKGLRTLFIDCDAQANATWTLLAGQGAEGPSLASVLMRQADAEEAIRPSSVANLDILPADEELSGVNVALVQEVGRDARLRKALAPLEGAYDAVILDTAPTFTTILANALVYASEVIVPVDPTMFAMLGLVQLQKTIEEVREAYGNDALHLAGLLITKASRNNVAKDVEAELRARFGELVYQAVIPLSAKVEEAHTRAQTVLQWSPKSPGALAYLKFVEEVLSNGRAKGRRGGASSGGSAGEGNAA